MNTIPDYARILSDFGIRPLGAGCPLAGADILTSQCAALAAVAHPDSCLSIAGTGQTIPVGINVLATSALTASCLLDHVMEPLRKLQNQHLHNTQARSAMHLEEVTRGMVSPERWKESPTYDTGSAIILEEDPMLMARDMPARVFGRDPRQDPVEARLRPSFFLESSDLKLLSRHINTCHLRRPMLHVHAPNQVLMTMADAVFHAVTNGVTPDTELPFQVRGHVIASTAPAIFDEILKGRERNGGMIEHTLWLTGTPHGPWDWPKETKPAEPPVQTRFQTALEEVLERRMKGQAVVLKITPAVAGTIYDFMDSLRMHEGQLAGITGSLRSLVPTLIFGISLMYETHMDRDSPAIKDTGGILVGFAEALAQRMVAYKQTVLYAERLDYVQHVASSLCMKLRDGPHTPRALIRRSNRLRIADCREALEFLATTGAVAVDGDVWRLTQSPVLSPVINLKPTTDQ